MMTLTSSCSFVSCDFSILTDVTSVCRIVIVVVSFALMALTSLRSESGVFRCQALAMPVGKSRQRHYIIAFFPAQERRRKESFSSRLKGRGCMSTRFIPKEKLSKKARRELNAARRTLWVVSPISKKVESKKVYNRKKIRPAVSRRYRADIFILYSLSIYAFKNSPIFSASRMPLSYIICSFSWLLLSVDSPQISSGATMSSLPSF